MILEVLGFLEHCPNLTYLDLSYAVLSPYVRVLCGQKLIFNLRQLYLESCCFNAVCIPPLCEFLTDERCNLTLLSLAQNNLGDEGLRMLSNRALVKEHCKLENLDVTSCYFGQWRCTRAMESIAK